MTNKINYQKILDKTLTQISAENKTPTLLLHACCAPCSSYCIEYLSNYFEITIFYYNPNIYPQPEYHKRVEEIKRFISEIPVKNKVSFIEGEYETNDFYNTIKGLENISEGGKRCFACYKLRLERTAKEALKGNFDYFTTTLSISPLKNSQVLNTIGLELEKQYHIPYLVSDFKKKNGYKRSIELSREYNLYRQDYCGCVYSQIEREKQKAENALNR